MLTLRPPAFIETEDSCNGIRYVRGQPNRESPGVTMTEIQDKYIPEFELPFRNIDRYIHEMNNNWDRLNPEQRRAAQASFERMGMLNKKESFGNTVHESVMDVAKYIAQQPEIRVKELLTILWTPTETQKTEITKGLNSAEAEQNLADIRAAVYDWTTDQSYGLYTNWKSGLLLFFLVVLFLLIGVAAGLGSN